VSVPQWPAYRQQGNFLTFLQATHSQPLLTLVPHNNRLLATCGLLATLLYNSREHEAGVTIQSCIVIGSLQQVSITVRHYHKHTHEPLQNLEAACIPPCTPHAPLGLYGTQLHTSQQPLSRSAHHYACHAVSSQQARMTRSVLNLDHSSVSKAAENLQMMMVRCSRQQWPPKATTQHKPTKLLTRLPSSQSTAVSYTPCTG